MPGDDTTSFSRKSSTFNGGDFMRRRGLRSSILTILTSIALLFLAGCADETGNPFEFEFAAERVLGDFRFTSYEHGNTVRFGEANFDGTGFVSYRHHVNSSEPLENGAMLLSIDDDGRLSSPDELMAGMACSNRRMISAIGIHPGYSNELILLLKEPHGMSAASLSGSYYFTNYEYGNRVRFGVGEFGGNGLLSVREILDSGGNLDNGYNSYSVSSDGRISISSDNGDLVVGMISSDGEVGSMIGVYPGMENEIMIFIKRSSGMSNASLKGSYYLTDYMHGNSVAFAEIEFDGKDSASYRILSSSDWDFSPGTLNYTVSPDGKLTMAGDDIGMTIGMISNDGAIFSAVGIYSAGEENEIMIGMKKCN